MSLNDIPEPFRRRTVAVSQKQEAEEEKVVQTDLKAVKNNELEDLLFMFLIYKLFVDQ